MKNCVKLSKEMGVRCVGLEFCGYNVDLVLI